MKLPVSMRMLRGFVLMLAVLLAAYWISLPGHAQSPETQSQSRSELQPEPRSEITRITPLLRDDKLYVDADIDLALGTELRAAVDKGLPLYFVLEVQITAQYRWWFDKTVVDARRSYRLSYNVLTRQWRMVRADLGSSERSGGDWALPLPTLEDALSSLRRVRGWAVSEADHLKPDTRYVGRMRLRLDTARLPRPFQIDALNRSTWTLATPWKTFPFAHK